MIKHMRTDSRMIHGQVVVNWMGQIGANEIIVCNDAASTDKLMLMALPMAARKTPVRVLSIADTIQYVKDHEEETLFVVCKTPEDALALLEAGLKPEEVNVGTNAPVGDYKMISNFVACNPEQAKAYLKIADYYGGVLTSRITVQNEPVDIVEAIKKNGLA